MNKVKVGVIGTGSMGEYHVDCYSKLEARCQLVGVYDINENKTAKVAQKYGIKSFDSALDLIKNVEAVSIVTPTSTHYEMALKTFNLNRHILLEKPMTINLDEAKSLIEISEEKNIVLQIGHIERFNPVIKALPEILKEENILAAQSRRMGPYDPRIQDTDVIQDLMIHDIDIINNFIPGSVDKITADGMTVKSRELIDYARAGLVMNNGIIVDLTASRITNKKVRKLTITTDKSYIEIDYLNREISIYSRKVSDTDNENELIEENNHKFDTSENPLKSELADFINCIQNKSQPLVSGNDGYQALQITKKIQDKIYNE